MSDKVERIRVWVRSRFDGDRGWRGRHIQARIFGPLAVHPTFVMVLGKSSYAAVPSSDRFTVAHVGTGTAIESGLREQDAIGLVEALRREPLSDAFWTDVASVKAFQERLSDPLVQLADKHRKQALKATQDWECGEAAR